MNPHYTPDKINSYFIEQVKDYAIFAMDKDGIICTWNQGVEKVKGYKEKEFVGEFFGMLFPDEYQQADKPRLELKTALEKGVYESRDWRKRKDGSLFWANIKLTPPLARACNSCPFFSTQPIHSSVTTLVRCSSQHVI
jgi:PAS domain S-box-containing protein